MLALVRGDDRLEAAKLVAALKADVRPATEDEIRAAFGADPGSLGPVGFDGEIVADETLREGQFVAGANRTGWHLRGVEARARLRGALRRPARADRGRPLPRVRRRAAVPDRDRGRPHLQARHALLGAARRDVPRRGRHREAADHGQLRHRPRPDHGRGRRAAPRRQGDLLARRDRPVRRARRRAAGRRGAGRGGGARAVGGRARRPARRPRPARGREVRRRRPDRPADARDGRQEDARGRHGRRARPQNRRRERV